MRSFLRFNARFASVALVVLMAACSDSSSSATTPLDPPRLRIESIDAAGGPQWVPGGCLQAGTDPEKTIVLTIGPNDKAGPDGRGGHLLSPGSRPASWTLSSPFSCSGTPPCGFLVLSVYSCTSLDLASCSCPSPDPTSCGEKPLKQFVAASTSIALEMAELNTPGFFRLHVDLKNQDTTPALDAEGNSHPADLVVEVSAQCGNPPPPPIRDAGQDGAPVGDAVAPPPPEGGRGPDSAPPPLPGPDTGAPPPDTGTPPDTHPDATTPMDASTGPAPEAGPSPTDAGPILTDAAASD